MVEQICELFLSRVGGDMPEMDVVSERGSSANRVKKVPGMQIHKYKSRSINTSQGSSWYTQPLIESEKMSRKLLVYTAANRV